MRFRFSPGIFLLVGVLISALTLSFISCDKKLVSYNPDFKGTWRTDTLDVTNARNEIIVQGKDGLFNFYCLDDCGDRLCGCTSKQSGRAVVNTDHTAIKIGSNNATPLSIDKQPYDSSGIWKMKIGGLIYFRQ